MKIDWKEAGIDILTDIVAGALIAAGVYNFALQADFRDRDHLVPSAGDPGRDRDDPAQYPCRCLLLSVPGAGVLPEIHEDDVHQLRYYRLCGSSFSGV